MWHGDRDVEVETVLAHLGVGVPHLRPGESGEHHVFDLDAAVRLGDGVADTRPSGIKEGIYAITLSLDE